MQQQPRLFIPALGGIYRTFAPITEPLIRVVAGGSLAMHGFPILFGNIGAADKFLESTGFQNCLFWAYVVGAVEFVCGLFLTLGFLTRVVPHRSSAFSSSPSSPIISSSDSHGRTAGSNIRCSGRSWYCISWCAAAVHGRSTR